VSEESRRYKEARDAYVRDKSQAYRDSGKLPPTREIERSARDLVQKIERENKSRG
jgi:hypothetical protein